MNQQLKKQEEAIKQSEEVGFYRDNLDSIYQELELIKKQLPSKIDSVSH